MCLLCISEARHHARNGQSTTWAETAVQLPKKNSKSAANHGHTCAAAVALRDVLRLHPAHCVRHARARRRTAGASGNAAEGEAQPGRATVGGVLDVVVARAGGARSRIDDLKTQTSTLNNKAKHDRQHVANTVTVPQTQ